MPRTTRYLIIALILAAVVYGAAKLAVWYTVKDMLSDARQSLSPVASMEYARILAPVFGPFGVTGIRVQPHFFADEVTIGSALIQITEPGEKYKLLRATLQNTVPNSFNLSLNQVRLPFDGNIAAWIDGNTDPPESTTDPPATCVSATAVTVADMKKMNYEDLVANIVFDYTYDRRKRDFAFYAKAELEEMFEVILEGRIPRTDAAATIDSMDGLPKLSNLSISLNDLSWSSRLNRYCAKAMNITETQYVERKTTEMRQALADLGLDASGELMKGLERFAKGKSELTLIFNPREPLAPSQIITQQNLRLLLDELGVSVIVDGRPVRSLRAGNNGEAAEAAREAREVDETYKLTPVRELPRFLKSRIRIFTADGKIHEGHLDSINSGKIVLTRYLAGGSATFDIDRKTVKKVLVLRN